MAVTATIIVGLAGYVGVGIVDDVATYTESADEWCTDHSGELQKSNVIGPQGGLYCKLPNGTTVHVSDYVEVDST